MDFNNMSLFANIGSVVFHNQSSEKKEEFFGNLEHDLSIFNNVCKDIKEDGIPGILDDMSKITEDFDDLYDDYLQDNISFIDVINGVTESKNNEKTKPLDLVKAAALKTSLSAINNSLNSKPVGKISDSEISNTKEFNGITNRDMMLLSNIAYSNITCPENKGKTMGSIVQEMKDTLSDASEPGFIDASGNITEKGANYLIENEIYQGSTDTEAISQILNEILNNQELYTLTILDNTDQVENYIHATTYGHLDENGKLTENPTVVFRGTANATAWKDNAEGLTDTDTQLQKAALEYMERQQYTLQEYNADEGSNISLTVTGHSKGGNMAMYSAIKDENVTNCVSFDGQGFNDKFIEEYQDLITENKNKITSVNTYIDPVSSLLNPVAGNTKYVGVVFNNSPTDKNGNVKLNNHSQITDAVWDAHSPETMYKAINSNGNDNEWTLYDKSSFSQIIRQVSESTESMDDSAQTITSKIVAELFVKYFSNGSQVHDNNAKRISPPFDLEEHDVTIIKTEIGYNVYQKSADSGNTILTLDKNGNLATGVLEPYSNGNNEKFLSDLKETIKEIDKNY